MGFPTPDAIPTVLGCRALFWPDNEHWIAVVTGALNLLAIPEQWDKVGALTPQEAADAWIDFFDMFCFQQGTCRVIGEIIPFAGFVSPDDRWLICDGASLLIEDYPLLFIQLGTNYGQVDIDHFNIPDLRGRTPVGAGTGSGLSARALGDSFGTENHELTVGELPAHTHADAGHIHAEGIAAPAVGAAIVGVPIPSAIPAVGATGSASANITNTGNDDPHNNIQPSLCINYLIVVSV